MKSFSPIVLLVLLLASACAGAGGRPNDISDPVSVVETAPPGVDGTRVPESASVPAGVSHVSLPQEVPPLPFPDNPDPAQCGIPTVWGKDEPAWITGSYEGELIQPLVYLYDSHLRMEIVGAIPHGRPCGSS